MVVTPYPTGVRMLIIEDSPLFGDIYSEKLTLLRQTFPDSEIWVVKRLDEGIAIAAKASASDLVILDLGLEGSEWHQAVAQIDELNCESPSLVISCHPEAQIRGLIDIERQRQEPDTMKTPRDDESVRNILLIGHDEGMLEVLTEILSKNPRWRIKAVFTMADGLGEMLLRDFDVIVCEFIMPRIRGDALFFTAQKFKPEVSERFIFRISDAEVPDIAAFFETTQIPFFSLVKSVPDFVAAVANVIARTAERSER